MGVIDGVVAEVEDHTDSELDARHANGDGPYLSREIGETLDPFVTEFDLANVRLGREDLKILLGTLLVISNVFGD